MAQSYPIWPSSRHKDSVEFSSMLIYIYDRAGTMVVLMRTHFQLDAPELALVTCTVKS